MESTRQPDYLSLDRGRQSHCIIKHGGVVVVVVVGGTLPDPATAMSSRSVHVFTRSSPSRSPTKVG